jgi:hypothetical protein
VTDAGDHRLHDRDVPLAAGAGRAQLQLFEPESLEDVLERDEEATCASSAGEFSGARLFDRDPHRYMAIVRLRGEGYGLLRIARLLRVSVNTVAAVRDREVSAIETVKQHVAGRASLAGELAVESIIEDLADPERRKMIAARDRAIIAGVMIDKAQLLGGGATARIEHVDRGGQHEDLNSYLDSLPRVQEVAGDGLGEAGAGVKGGDAGAAGGAAGVNTEGSAADGGDEDGIGGAAGRSEGRTGSGAGDKDYAPTGD